MENYCTLFWMFNIAPDIVKVILKYRFTIYIDIILFSVITADRTVLITKARDCSI